MILPTPYYDKNGITLYHADALDLLPRLPRVDAIITDPVWPNASIKLPGADKADAIFCAAATHFPSLCDRAAIHLGAQTNPRILRDLDMPFFRTCQLDFAFPTYRGRLLYTGDTAYLFGTPPPSTPGKHLIPGRMTASTPAPQIPGHPCPRNPEHVLWLLDRFGGPSILDPFFGSGTTAVAARLLAVRFIGTEIHEAYCAIAVERLESIDFTAAKAPPTIISKYAQ